MIDLHMHSTFSDGTYTPEELVDEGIALGLSAIALTDHDTVAGLRRFMKAGEERGLKTIPAIEISSDHGPEDLHILGYMIDEEDLDLLEHLAWSRQGRDARNQEVLHKLNALGFHLVWEEVIKCAGSDLVGRPHFAQAMMQRGYVKSKKEAFNKYLGRNKLAYAARRRFEPEECVELIAHAGGLPVIAHPYTLNMSRAHLRKMLINLMHHGLQGLEVYYPEHTPVMQKMLFSLSKELGLVATGGSDFHGAFSGDISMGRGFGSTVVPDRVMTNLVERKAQMLDEVCSE